MALQRRGSETRDWLRGAWLFSQFTGIRPKTEGDGAEFADANLLERDTYAGRGNEQEGRGERDRWKEEARIESSAVLVGPRIQGGGRDGGLVEEALRSTKSAGVRTEMLRGRVGRGCPLTT